MSSCSVWVRGTAIHPKYTELALLLYETEKGLDKFLISHLRVPIAMKKYRDNGNSYNWGGLRFQRFSLISSQWDLAACR